MKARALFLIGRLGVACASLTLVLVWASVPAAAEITSGCTATVAGQEVDGRSSDDPRDAIKVNFDHDVTVILNAPAAITGYKVEMEFAGIRFPVAQGTTDGSSWTQTVPVSQYSKYGVGLYKVIGSATGSGACSAAFLIDVIGKDPLGVPVGEAAAAVLAIGALGTVAATAMSALGAGDPQVKGYLESLGMIENHQMPDSAIQEFIDPVYPAPNVGTQAMIDYAYTDKTSADTQEVIDYAYTDRPPADTQEVVDYAYTDKTSADAFPSDAASVEQDLKMPGYIEQTYDTPDGKITEIS